MSMKDVLLYKCLFVWEAQLFTLQAFFTRIPCAPPCTLSAAAQLSSAFADISPVSCTKTVFA